MNHSISADAIVASSSLEGREPSFETRYQGPPSRIRPVTDADWDLQVTAVHRTQRKM